MEAKNAAGAAAHDLLHHERNPVIARYDGSGAGVSLSDAA